GPEIFSRIIKELTQIMSEKGYTSIDEFKGKLRTIS
ncbi:TPA: dihydroorotate oxidase, partial [Enterococcus faecium]